MLTQVHPVVRSAVAMILAELQALGFRPRIQCAWRSTDQQTEAHDAGVSQLPWGFHNPVTPAGEPDALAVDVLEDDHPLSPSRAYVLALARAARLHGCQTGLLWGLPLTMRVALQNAVVKGQEWSGPIGWDACHVEWVGISIAQAKAGMRPKSDAAPTVNV